MRVGGRSPWQRIVSLALCLAMLLSFLPATARAVEGTASDPVQLTAEQEPVSQEKQSADPELLADWLEFCRELTGTEFQVLYTLEDRYLPNEAGELITDYPQIDYVNGKTLTQYDLGGTYRANMYESNGKSDFNDTSTVLKVFFENGRDAILYADMNLAENVLFTVYPDETLATDIMMVPHHGHDAHPELAALSGVVSQNSGVGAVPMDANGNDCTITVTFQTPGGVKTENVKVTVGMLSEGTGVGVDTSVTGEHKNLTLTYGGQVITNAFTLIVSDTDEELNYPAYPEEGSVRVDKQGTTTEEDFSATGVANIQLSATGIYDKNEFPVLDFPEPEVNVPADVTVTAKDKIVYYGDEPTASDLLDKVAAGGLEVTINPDGTFTPQEDRMDDFSDLTWTADSTKPGDSASGTEPKDYPFEVVLKPNAPATDNEKDPGNIAGDPVAPAGKTSADNGHIFVLVPEVTFRDSVTEPGTPTAGYDYENQNLVSVEWELMPDGKTPAVDLKPGAAPELELTFTPEDHVTEFIGDTKVEVTVSRTDGKGTDLDSVTDFEWDNCGHDEHGSGTGDTGASGSRRPDHRDEPDRRSHRRSASITRTAPPMCTTAASPTG